jgi:hypothetical protein
VRRLGPGDRRELRQFGIGLAVLIAGLFGWLVPWLADQPPSRWPWIAAAVLLPLAAFAPVTVYPLYRALYPLLRALTALNNALLLGAVYFLLLWPLGLLLRAAARLHYRTGFDPTARSYRVPVDPGHTTNLEEPF